MLPPSLLMEVIEVAQIRCSAAFATGLQRSPPALAAASGPASLCERGRGAERCGPTRASGHRHRRLPPGSD